MTKKYTVEQIAMKLKTIKYRLQLGQLTYSEANEEAAPIIQYMNDVSIKTAKKFNAKPKLFNFSSLMR